MAQAAAVTEFITSDNFTAFADFVNTCKNGDTEESVKFLRQVVLTIDPNGLKPSLPRKKQRVATPVKAEAAAECVVEPLDFSYHAGDEVDSKPATLLLLIPNKSAVIAAVIGKSGANIAQTQKASGANVQVDKSENKSADHVEVKITGTVSSNDMAQAMIMQKIVSATQGKDTPEPAPQHTLLVVPNQAVGFLIGKGGAVIKELQLNSGAHIQFENEKDTKPGAAGRQVTIQSASEAIRNKCAYLVSRKLAEDAKVDVNWVQKKETRMPQATGVSSEQLMGLSQPFDYNAFLGNSGGGMVQPQQNMYQDYFPPAMPQMPSLPNPFTAQMPSVPSSNPMGSLSGMAPMMGGQPTTTVDMLVPNVAVSRLIGKQGKNITEMQSSTGARIQFQKETEMLPGATDRKVTLTGTAIQTTAAQQTITMQIMQIQQVPGLTA
ncbi:hypothetical protein CYMTET_23554 [Cymbomonas tetramitiformis]|uniref:K Homology domain-containing protein n=1 Tax=Cymbomonas tetramitiformis TaxID=36881 RepID=A0AAE0FYD5_9CHLO|nr:hypothetical protein CYMTET_23554 [Cymbomonas tetramitiformis]